MHRAAIEQLKLQKQPAINTQLDMQIAQEQQKNWKMLLKQLSSIRMLLGQGLALLGHDELERNLLQFPSSGQKATPYLNSG